VSPRSLLLLLAPLALLSCKRDRSAPVQAVASELDARDASPPSGFLDTPPALTAVLGAVRFFVAKPGDYRATLRYEKLFFRSTESTEDTNVSALAMLRLDGSDDGGVASACFFADANVHFATGKYGSADHLPHSSDSARPTRIGGQGTWKLDARGWAIVSLVTAPTCPAPSSPDAGAGHLELRCVGASRPPPNDAPAVMCDDEAHVLRDVSMPLGALGQPWTWMAAAPGAAIAWRQRNDDATVTLDAADVKFDAAAWK
jgi:hypothetical protein